MRIGKKNIKNEHKKGHTCSNDRFGSLLVSAAFFVVSDRSDRPHEVFGGRTRRNHIPTRQKKNANTQTENNAKDGPCFMF